MSILVSRGYINTNYVLKPGGTSDSSTSWIANISWITTNYYVSVSGIQDPDRCPGSDELTAITSLPIVTGLTISSISNSSFNGTANVISDGGDPAGIRFRGMCWGLSPNPLYNTVGYTKDALTQSLGVYTVSCTSNINPGSIYYVRAWAQNDYGVGYSTELTVNTYGPPTLATTTGSAVDYDTINVTGNVIRDNNATITTRGICWSTTSNPTTANSTQSTSGTVGSYTLTINSLSTSTYYYFRAYATNSYGTGYGDQVYISTTGAIPPVVIINFGPYNTSAIQSYADGRITEWGGATVNQKGLCWSSTNSNPLIGNSSFSNDGTATSNITWSGIMTNLTPNTTYYFRAYAMNLAYSAVSYSSVYTVSTPPCSSIEADVQAEATSELLCALATKVGHIMSADTNSLYTATKLYSGSDCYTYAGAGYYNVWGNPNWRYWNGSSFTGSGTCPVTTTTTVAPTTTTTTTPSSALPVFGSFGYYNYNVYSTYFYIENDLSNPACTLLTRGICYSTTNSTPTISDSTTSMAATTGNFSTLVSGLSPSTYYYVRGYASNCNGLAYSSTVLYILTAAGITTTTTTTNRGPGYYACTYDACMYYSSDPGPSCSACTPTYYSFSAYQASYAGDLCNYSPDRTVTIYSSINNDYLRNGAQYYNSNGTQYSDPFGGYSANSLAYDYGTFTNGVWYFSGSC